MGKPPTDEIENHQDRKEVVIKEVLEINTAFNC